MLLQRFRTIAIDRGPSVAFETDIRVRQMVQLQQQKRQAEHNQPADAQLQTETHLLKRKPARTNDRGRLQLPGRNPSAIKDDKDPGREQCNGHKQQEANADRKENIPLDARQRAERPLDRLHKDHPRQTRARQDQKQFGQKQPGQRAARRTAGQAQGEFPTAYVYPRHQQGKEIHQSQHNQQ